METENRINELNLKIFRNLALPTLIFAVVSTFCLYSNFNGFTMIIFIAAVIVYDKEIARRFELPSKPGFIWYAIGMMLLGLADITTDSWGNVFYNNCMIFVLMVSLQIYLFYDQAKWRSTTYIRSFIKTMLLPICYLGHLFDDIQNALASMKDSKSKNGFYLLVGILIFIPFGVILLSLLSSADAVFESLVVDAFNRIFSTYHIFTVPLFFIVFFVGAYCSMRFLSGNVFLQQAEEKAKWPAIVSNTVLFMTSIMYLVFSLIQIGALFLGKMTLPEGETYSSYAREGFGQLIFVCFVNICLVLFVKGCFENGLFTKILLAVISCCTYIMLASSAMRLYLYISVYKLSILRVQAVWALVMMAIGMAIVMISVFTDRIHLVHTLMTLGVIGIFSLSMIHPDALVARYNINAGGTTWDDYRYLTTLSIDAAKYISEVDNVWVDSYKREMWENIDELDFREYNVSLLLNRKYIK